MAKAASLVTNIKRKSKTKLDKLYYKVRNFNLIFKSGGQTPTRGFLVLSGVAVGLDKDLW